MSSAALRLLFIIFIAAGAACSSSPTVSPSPISPSPTPTPAPTNLTPAPPSFQLAGIWKGFLKITDATDYAASEIGKTLPFTLRLAGGPQSFTGQFEVALYPARYVNVGVAGSLRADGFAMLSGASAISGLEVTVADVSELIVRTDDSSGLTGTIRFGQRGDGYNARLAAQILSASLQPNAAFPGGAVEGHWVGLAIIKACSGYCRVTVGYTRAIELVLRQSGNMLSGTGYFDSFGNCSGPCWLPLTGAASGDSINVTGRLTQELRPDWSGDRLMILSDFSATVDDLGRMHAQFVYSSEGQRFQGDPNRPSPASSRLTMESVWLTRQP
jgi:hypothetical protein